MVEIRLRWIILSLQPLNSSTSMKTVYLLRHAKTEEGRDKSDRERMLTDRGHRCAVLLGEYLRQKSISPDCILCSTATRCRETLDDILSRTVWKTPAIYEESIYGADATFIAKRLGQLSDGVNAALWIGHNPGLQVFAAQKSEEGQGVHVSRAYEGFATCTLAKIEFPIAAWRAIASPQCRGVMADFIESEDLI